MSTCISTAGSLISAIPVYLLLQHKASLGDKRITHIAILRDHKAKLVDSERYTVDV